MKKDLAVLLSTYNGSQYLEEQLNSLLLQDYQGFDIIIRDDGSSDGTIDLLKKYSEMGIKVTYGNNIGYVKSFFRLLKDNIKKYDYFAFCDQDDYWYKNKISKAIGALKREKNDTPVLYFSSYEIVDENLNLIGYPYKPKLLSFVNALVENVVPGCSCVFNKAAGMIVLKHLPEQGVRFHDWWLFLTISALGKVIYDPVILFKYRQHGKNTIGTTCGIIDNIMKKIKNRLKGNKTIPSLIFQARLFYDSYHTELSNENKKVVLSFINTEKCINERLRWFFSKTRKRQSITSDIFLRIAILFQL